YIYFFFFSLQILNLIGFFISLICFALYMILREALTETVIQEVRVYFQEMKANSSHKEVNEIEERSEEVIEFIETHIETVKIILLIAVCQQLLDVICSSCLIHGIRRNRRGLLLPWAITHCLYLVIELSILVVYIVLLVYLSEFYSAILPSMAVLLIWMALHIYFILVVISQYQALGLIRMHDEMCMK
ncbi:hypothetical protein Anas_01187, partial [Armadillidium nasatum]